MLYLSDSNVSKLSEVSLTLMDEPNPSYQQKTGGSTTIDKSVVVAATHKFILYTSRVFVVLI